MSMSIETRLRPPREIGAVLVVCMVVLAIVSLLALNSIKFSVLEQIFANNARWQADALVIAEDGVIDGEQDIATNFSGVPTFDWSADTTDGFYYAGDIADIDSIWSGNSGHQTGGEGSLYALEYLGPYTTEGASVTVGAGTGTNRRFLYRVTGWGGGAKGGMRLVQSIYATTE